MAHKKGLGSSRNGRDSNAKRLGVKVFAGQVVTGGEIIVRQRGTRFRPGDGVGIGKDDTIYAKRAGIVQFREGRRGRMISVEPGDGTPAASTTNGEKAAASTTNGEKTAASTASTSPAPAASAEVGAASAATSA